METKTCSKCSETKPVEEFSFRSDKPHLKKSHCKECHRKSAREHWRKNPPTKELQRERNLKNKFGITLEDYATLLEGQEFCCAICGSHESFFDQSMPVDHCHSTQKIRGILCKDCNVGLGNFKDSTTRLRQAIQYLEKFNDN